jgi:hypothetical protein
VCRRSVITNLRRSCTSKVISGISGTRLWRSLYTFEPLCQINFDVRGKYDFWT